MPSTGDHALEALFASDPGRFAAELKGWLEDRTGRWLRRLVAG